MKNPPNKTSLIKNYAETQEKNSESRVIFENLQMYYHKSGLPQSQFALVAGVSAVCLNRWLQGVNTPKMKNLKKLADYLQIDVREFFIPHPQKGGSTAKTLQRSESEWKQRALTAERTVKELRAIIPAIIEANHKLNEANSMISEATKRLSKISL